MTKYSKMKKSSFAILALSLILVAVFAFGGTYAYFNDEVTSGTTSVTTATLTLSDSVTITGVADNTHVPGQSQSITLTDVALSGTTVSAVRFGISNIEFTGTGAAALTPEQKALLTIEVEVAAADATGWVKHTDNYYYWNAYVSTLDIDASTSISVALAGTAGNEWQDITATFSLTFEAEQAEYRVGDKSASPAFVIAEAAALFA